MRKYGIMAWCLLPLVAMLVQIAWARISADSDVSNEGRWQRLVEISVLAIPLLNLLIVGVLFE